MNAGSIRAAAVALLGRLIARGSGTTLPEFAQQALFAPLGITAFERAQGREVVSGVADRSFPRRGLKHRLGRRSTPAMAFDTGASGISAKHRIDGSPGLATGASDSM